MTNIKKNVTNVKKRKAKKLSFLFGTFNHVDKVEQNRFYHNRVGPMESG